MIAATPNNLNHYPAGDPTPANVAPAYNSPSERLNLLGERVLKLAAKKDMDGKYSLTMLIPLPNNELGEVDAAFSKGNTPRQLESLSVGQSYSRGGGANGDLGLTVPRISMGFNKLKNSTWTSSIEVADPDNNLAGTIVSETGQNTVSTSRVKVTKFGALKQRVVSQAADPLAANQLLQENITKTTEFVNKVVISHEAADPVSFTPLQ